MNTSTATATISVPHVTAARLTHLPAVLASALAVFAALASACPPVDGEPTTSGSSGLVETSTTTDGNSETGSPVTTSATEATNATGASTDATSTTDATGGPTTTDAESSGGSSSESTTGEANVCDPLPALGEPLGECRPVGDTAGRCDGDGKCLSLDEGSICQPTCADCTSGEHDDCIDALSEVEPNGRGVCHEGQGCDVSCAADDDCAEPLVCGHATTDGGEFDACVWPHGSGDGQPAEPLPPPTCDEWHGGGSFITTQVGEAGGPCTSVPDCDPGLACVAGKIGGRCVPLMCQVDACTVAEACQGVHPGMLCDPTTAVGNACVWPWPTNP